MKFDLILAVDDGDGHVTNISLGQVARPEVSDMATFGLSLAESKQLLAQLQHEVVVRQFEATTQQRRHCEHCGTKRAIKDFHGARFRSLFGDVDLRVPRLRKCQCAVGEPAPASVKPASRQRWVAPELEYVQSELAATLPYARSAEILHKLLPIGVGNGATTVRARTLRVGQRLESELATATVKPPGRRRAPRPRVTTVGLDGGYVRHCDSDEAHSFEIIAGRVMADDGSQRSVGFVRTVDQHSRTRVQQAVAEHGKTTDGLLVLTDGDSRLRDLQLSVLPEATHVLDWYHLTRRLTVLSNVVRSREAAQTVAFARACPDIELGRLDQVASLARPARHRHRTARRVGESAWAAFFGRQDRRGSSSQACRRVASISGEQRRIVTRLWPAISSW